MSTTPIESYVHAIRELAQAVTDGGEENEFGAFDDPEDQLVLIRTCQAITVLLDDGLGRLNTEWEPALPGDLLAAVRGLVAAEVLDERGPSRLREILRSVDEAIIGLSVPVGLPHWGVVEVMGRRAYYGHVRRTDDGLWEVVEPRQAAPEERGDPEPVGWGADEGTDRVVRPAHVWPRREILVGRGAVFAISSCTEQEALTGRRERDPRPWHREVVEPAPLPSPIAPANALTHLLDTLAVLDKDGTLDPCYGIRDSDDAPLDQAIRAWRAAGYPRC